MSPTKLARAGKVALIAFYRAFVLEGDDTVTIGTLARRIGYKGDDRLNPPVVSHMSQKGWIIERGDELTLTPNGKMAAQQILDRSS